MLLCRARVVSACFAMRIGDLLECYTTNKADSGIGRANLRAIRKYSKGSHSVVRT